MPKLEPLQEKSQKRAAVLFSGGKDSTYTIQLLRNKGLAVVCLVTVFSQNPESYMLHTANIELAKLSADALEIPIFTGTTLGEKEQEMEDMKRIILEAKQKYDFHVLGSGGLASNYQKTRIQRIAEACNLDSEAPLWGVDQKNYMETLISSGYHFIITSVSAEGLDRTWLGKEIDKESLVRLESLSQKYGFNLAFEGGEAETLVVDCPLFKTKKIRIVDSRVDWRGYYGVLEIKKAELVSKDLQGNANLIDVDI